VAPHARVAFDLLLRRTALMRVRISGIGQPPSFALERSQTMAG
jgi:hypothetical protein